MADDIAAVGIRPRLSAQNVSCPFMGASLSRLRRSCCLSLRPAVDRLSGPSVNAQKARATEPIDAKRPYRCVFFIVITIINGGARKLKQP